MPAPIGNKFWELRSKHGRDKLFATAELLWEAACEYFEWCLENPLIAIEFHGKDGAKREVPKMRAFTIMGLSHYLDVNSDYLSQFEASLKGSDAEDSKDFSRVITRIREVIYQQKFEGAAAGFLNANIIARDLGLSDKKEIDANVNYEIIVDGHEDD